LDDSFDPYWKWLGIPPQEQPPNFYRLLGIALFEEDPDVIHNAADRQMAHVRTFQTGTRGGHSQEILNELSTAKVCLLDPERKRLYDAQLRGSRTAAAAQPAAQPPVAAPQPARGIARPAAPPGGLAVAVPARPVAVVRPVTAVSEESPIGLPRSVSSSLPRIRRRSSQAPLVGAVLGIAMLVILALVVWSLGEKAPSTRNDDARGSGTAPRKPVKPISDAQETAKSAPAKSSVPKWKSDPRIKIRPRNTDDESLPIENGPNPASDDEPTKKPDEAPAKSEANESDQPDSDTAATTPPEEAKSEPPQPQPKPDAGVAAKRVPMPARPLVERAYRLIHPTYKESITQAKTPELKLALAKELQTSAETHSDAPTQAALFELAKNLTVLAVDPQATCEVIDTLAGRFDVDPFEYKRQALDEINKLVLKPDEYRKLLPTFKQLISAALSAERYDAAVALAKVAKVAGAKTKDAIDIKEVNSQLDDVADLERIVQNFKKFEKQLADDPNDGVANLHAGRYFCVVRKDPAKGIAAFAKCNDAKLAELAGRDVAGTTEAARQIDLGDAWLEQAKRRGGVYRQPFASRARHWFEQAQAQAVDADKEKIAARLADADAALKPGL
jgi:hypothetical protein